MGPHTSRAFYDVLPAELTCLVIHYLLPHQLTGLASSCRRARYLVDHHFKKRIPSLDGERLNVTLLWASKFRKLPSGLQSAIEDTVAILPLLDVFAPISSDIETIYSSMSSALHHIQNGRSKNALSCIKEADQAALKTELNLELSGLRRQCWEAEFKSAIQKVELWTSKGFYEFTLRGIKDANIAAMNAGLPLPDFGRLLQEFWKKKLDLTLGKVKECTQQGSIISTLSHIEEANEAAINAGRPLPDFSGVMQECWEKSMDLAMDKVKQFTQRGSDIATLAHIEMANEAAMNAGRPLPDFSGVMQECWEKKMDLAMEKVKESAQQGLKLKVLYWGKIAKDAALKAGCPQPDWSEVTQPRKN